MVAPLKKANDACLLDSTSLSLMDVLKQSICFAATKIDFAAQRRTVSPDLKV
jgi:cytidylate kinase